MDIESRLAIESVILDLARSATDDEKKREKIELVLLYDTIRPLLVREDIDQVKSRLQGRSVRLTENQSNLVTLAKHLVDYEETIGPWTESEPKIPYAVEYIIKEQNPELAKTLSFEEIQVLKAYSKFYESVSQLHATTDVPEEFKQNAEDVANMLIGKTLLLPNIGKQIGMGIVETEPFERSEGITRARYCMLAPPGQIDFMPCRGHQLFNIGTKAVNVPSCVMVRAAYIDENYIDSPGSIVKAIQPDLLKGKFVGVDILMSD